MPNVTAIVVTYNRTEVLAGTLEAIAAQRRPPDHVLVIDNSDTARDVARDAGAEYLSTGENGGYASGLAIGMRRAEAADWLWLMDDDSRPAPHALGTALDHAEPGVGAVGFAGGLLRWGIPRHDKGTNRPRDAHYLLVDGMIVDADAVRAVGYPRHDFFMMFEDIEFTERIRRAGWRLLLLPEAMDRQHLGSTQTAPWRAYYQTRNHLRVALERRDPRLIAGWVARTVVLVFANIRTSSHRKVARMRLKGAWDGLRGRMGRVVEPDAA